jgi:hypothetical protein
MNVIFVEEQEFNDLIADYRRRVKRFIPPRKAPSCEKISFSRRLRRRIRVKTINCYSMTALEAYSYGFISKPEPGHEGDLVIVCLITVG